MGTPRRYAARRDHNEQPLLKAAKIMGARIYISGPLDGWAHHAKTGWIPFEIKNGKNAPYTESQKEFMQWCKAWSMPVHTWRTEEDVITTFRGQLWNTSTVSRPSSLSKDSSKQTEKDLGYVRIADDIL
jgi:hypothetical protein